MNSIQLIGRLTKDIELKYTTKTQAAIANFRLAVDRPKKDAGAVFIRCKAIGKRAEIMEQYIKKGDQVALQGRWEQDAYEKDGVKHVIDYLFVENFDFIGTKKKSDDTQVNNDNDISDDLPDGFAQVNDDDLPF